MAAIPNIGNRIRLTDSPWYYFEVAMKYQWVLPDPIEPQTIESISQKHHIHPTIARILLQRSISSPESISSFFNPKIENLYDPFLMKDMEPAVDRIIRALQDGEQILIYGDYDVDGVTSVSILYDGLFRLGGKVSFFIPSRFNEGYGVSLAGIEKAKTKKAKLIITVDCGITAVKEIEAATQSGMDVIVCDHHEPGDTLPSAVAVLDPKRPDDPYPFKELAGCGVSYKILQAVVQKLKLNPAFAERYLDLVALGTAADIVQLIDENRIFVKVGLEKINNAPRPGIEALIKSCGLYDSEIMVSTIVFNLAPRLNAVGRISNAKKAVHLLTTDSKQQARNIARILERENQIRKNIDEETFESAKHMIEQQVDLDRKRVIVLANKEWHPGVIGIVASRIMEKYFRPTILISIQDGIGKGSARSSANFDIYQAFKHLEHLLINYGGHRFAAGITIHPDKIEELDEQINEFAQSYLQIKDLIPKLNIDAEVSFDQFTAEFFNDLKAMAPFGPSNMRPVFVSRNLNVFGQPGLIGQGHIRVKLKQNAFVLDAIAYNFGEYLDQLRKPGAKVDCAYSLYENHWNGQTTIQMKIKDFEVR